MGQPPASENDSKISTTLVFAVTIACIGNSFLYGYQIAVVNTPASIIKMFYNKTYYERSGGDWDSMVRYSEYVEDRNISDAEAMKKYNVATNGTNMPKGGVNATKMLKPQQFGADMGILMEEWQLDLLWSTTVSLFVLFGMFGAFSSAAIADFFGRKRGMIIITSIMFLAAIIGGITKVAKAPEALMFSRCLVGLHSGWNIALCPVYLAEISPKKIRGAVGTCHQLAITMGILVSNIFGLTELLGTEDLWPMLFAFNAIPALICLVFMPFAPESPRYLLIKKNEEEAAREVLKKLRSSDNVDDEIEDMRIEVGKSAGVTNYTIKELVTAPELKMAVVIACLLQVTQQWSGINAVMSYSSALFEQVSISEDTIPYLVVGTGLINVLCTVVAVPLMEKLGRRPLLLYPMVVMLVSFLLLLTLLNLSKKPELASKETAFAIVCIIAMHTYVIGFALGLGPIPFLVVGEIFRQEPRAAAMSLSTAFNWVCNLILMWTFPFLKSGLEEFVYLLFCVVLAGALVFIFFFVPETKNRTFDDIANSISFGGRARGQNRAYGVNGDEREPMDNTHV